MKSIPLTQGKVTIVSNQDFDWLSKKKWCAVQAPRKSRVLWYACRTEYTNGRKRNVWMHRSIAKKAGLAWSARYDHRDGDGLNNQRENIRPCTPTQNLANSQKTPGRTSTFKGVSWAKRQKKWQANCRGKYLGYHANEQTAHAAYVAAAIKEFGEFAHP